jgi:hypothetical protein
MRQAFGACRSVFYKWCKTKIGIQYTEALTDSERILQFDKETQERLISSPDFIKDKDYQNLTLMLDGLHIRLGGRTDPIPNNSENLHAEVTSLNKKGRIIPNNC